MRQDAIGVAVIGILLGAGPATAQVTRRPPSAKATPHAKEAPKDATASDAITLRDGKVLLGQVQEPATRGAYAVIVRRAWAEAHLADWAERWTKAEKDGVALAIKQRRERLVAWRRERSASAKAGNRIDDWIDKTIAGDAEPAGTWPLMVVRLPRGDVKTVQRRGQASGRALRLGWTLGFHDPETMPLEDLKDAIVGRGMAVAGDAPVRLDALLPPGVEPEPQWLLRRAATEAANDEGLRFLKVGNALMPEPEPGQPPDLSLASNVLAQTIQDLLNDAPQDPLPAKLAEVAKRGRSAAVVTALEIAPDMGNVAVEATLYGRAANGQWTRAIFRRGSVPVGDFAPGAVEAVADDPQVKSAFSLIDSIGPGLVSPEMKKKSLAVGATTKRALGMARAALAEDLSALALPLVAAKAPEPSPVRP